MTQTPSPEIPSPEPQTVGLPPATEPAFPPEKHLSELGQLLKNLEADDSSPSEAPPVFSSGTDNQLVQVRLGTAASLFAALQCKHSATAGHALRVALTCSAWSLKVGLKQEQRDLIEVAALLHDVGVIGVPDYILAKPGQLNSDEAAIVARARQMSMEILRRSCGSPEILEIVEYVPAWYDGSREGFQHRGKEIPLGARMITVVEAFDAMTTDHVYRSALSHERAMTELFDCAGEQFDPDLVEQFAEFRDADQSTLRREVAQRWLNSFDPEVVNSYWELTPFISREDSPRNDALFQAKLLENMHDAVVFIDAAGSIALWNRGAERLTGIAEGSVSGRRWAPELLTMGDEKGHPVTEDDCPVHCAIHSGVQSLRRLKIVGRNGQVVTVDTHAIPVIAGEGATLGAVMLFHDASSETTLEQRCQRLYEKSTKDPLTQVANRAEFDRVHETFVAAHQQQQAPCALLICDLDRFKQVNDTYGHQAGDDVIKSLASLLKSSCRPGDLVARYGGEEFVVLCADCDNATAARRAEQIRKALSQIPQARMDGRCATVSFGVTEIQPGDTPETMLRRADRALLMAKERGRNTVVQLGTGMEKEESETAGGFFARKRAKPSRLIQQTMTTPVPVKIAIEKLRGFVADHQAKIIKTEVDRVELEISDGHRSRLRRLTDRPVAFHLDLRFEEQRNRNAGGEKTDGGISRTRIHASITPVHSRDRRRDNLADRAREVLVSFRSYLMATAEETTTENCEESSKGIRLLPSWLRKK